MKKEQRHGEAELHSDGPTLHCRTDGLEMEDSEAKIGPTSLGSVPEVFSCRARYLYRLNIMRTSVTSN